LISLFPTKHISFTLLNRYYWIGEKEGGSPPPRGIEHQGIKGKRGRENKSERGNKNKKLSKLDRKKNIK